MNKFEYNYESLEVEIIEISVEKGFGGSDGTGVGDIKPGGGDDFEDLN
jgi:hypothetical protein